MAASATPHDETASSHSAFLATSPASCKLPMLDGNAKVVTRHIVTEVEFKQAGRLYAVANEANGSLGGIVCIAWALLLRCYTGQDQVCFELMGNVINEPTAQSEGHGDTRLVFNMAFQEGDVLSTCIRRASNSHTHLTQGLHRTPFVASSPQITSQSWNTTISMKGSGPERFGQSHGLPTMQPLNPTQVSEPAVHPSTFHTM